MQKQFILFKNNHKPYNTDLGLKLCRKRLYKTKYFRYLGIKIDKNLNRKIRIYYLTSKLNRANAVLEKLRHFVNSEILFKIYLFCYVGDCISNHPIFLDVDTLTSQILFIFSLFAVNVEMVNPWKCQLSTPYGSKVI